MYILESYNKDSITYRTMSLYSEGNDNISIIFYKSETERITLIDNGTTKTLICRWDWR